MMKFSANITGKLAKARSVCALTGAGISAESGVPTFRSPDGIWTKFKPEELANLDPFMRNPERVWDWYHARRKVMHEVQPNEGHRVLAAFGSMFPDFVLVTQNVDNLHQRAGSVAVLELHGNLERSYCIQCGGYAQDGELSDVPAVPSCARCGGMLRPDVVWFGEMLPQDVFREAESAAERCEVFLSIGTSAVVHPAASLPATAKRHGAYVLEINPEATEITPWVDETIRAAAGQALPQLYASLVQHRSVA